MRITQAYKLCLLTYKTSARSGAGLLVALLCTMLSSVAGRSGVIGFVLLNQGTSRFPRCLTRPLYDRALLASLAQLHRMKYTLPVHTQNLDLPLRFRMFVVWSSRATMRHITC